MTVSDPAGDTQPSFGGHLLCAIRYYAGCRIGLIIIAAVALGLGAYYNWGLLVAIGLAPILLGALPCVAMFASGLCMSGRKRVRVMCRLRCSSCSINPESSQPVSWEDHLVTITLGQMCQSNRPTQHYATAKIAAEYFVKGVRLCAK